MLFLLLGRVVLIAQNACPVPDSLYYAELTHQSVVVGWRADPGVVSWEILLLSSNRDTVRMTSLASRVSLGPDKIRYGNYYLYFVRAVCPSGMSDWSTLGFFNVPPDCQAQPPLQCNDARILNFPVGTGYPVPFNNCKNNISPDGTENILNFNVNQSKESRYITFKSANFVQNFRVFGRRVDTSTLNDCPDAANPAWKCLSDSLVGQTLVLRHLEAGDYQIWVKRDRSSQPATLNIQYLCNLTCETPPQTQTRMDMDRFYLDWEDAAGPWMFEVALREAGSPMVQTRIVSNQLEALWNFPPLASNTIYEWRVRKLCSADSSDWSGWNRFKTYFSNPPTLISCPVTTFAFAETRPYVFWNNCTKTQGYGYNYTIGYDIVNGGEYRTVVKSKQNRPFKIGYYSDCCGIQESCVADSAVTLNIHSYNRVYLYVIQEDTLPADYTIKAICPCPPSLVAPAAFLRSGGIGYLSWSSPSGFTIDTVEVELQPRNVPFTNVPNARAGYGFRWDTLDYQKDYYCRMRPLCDAPALWSDTIDLVPIFDCSQVGKLTCGQPLLLFLGKGYAPDIHRLENIDCWGHQRYATFTAAATGFHEFRTLRRSGNATAFMGLIAGCSNNVGNYVATGKEHVPMRAFLMNGQTYTLVLDKAETDTRGEFEVTVECTSNTFDRPYDAQGQLTAQELPIFTSCAPYSNVNATTDFTDPLPTAPNGNWKDGPSHTVWFWFEAPPYTGTVHISVKGIGTDPIDPQIAIVRADSLGVFPNPVLASAEDGIGTQEASLSYTGLTPGKRYLLMVDGMGAKTGTFCISYDTDVPLLNTLDTCETFTRNYKPSAQPDRWINLYGTRTAFEDGPLLAALQTSEDLGPISISVKRTADAPVLANGLKLLPRYFNINTARQPQFPVKLRLFYTIEDYSQLRFTPPFPADSIPILTFYDGINEDCSPFNNGTVPALATQPSQPVWISNFAFYLEGIVAHFSEFSAGGRLTSTTTEPGLLSSWRVYPNPTREGLWLAGEPSTPTDLQITLLHPTGVPVWQQQWSSGSGKQQQYIPVETLPAGMYQLLLRTAQTGESVVLKVFVH